MHTSHDSEPHASGLMEAGDGHQVYWECHGNPTGRPAVYFHGGPGSGFNRLETAWHLSQRWTTSRLQVIGDAGHGGGGFDAALRAALAEVST